MNYPTGPASIRGDPRYTCYEKSHNERLKTGPNRTSLRTVCFFDVLAIFAPNFTAIRRFSLQYSEGKKVFKAEQTCSIDRTALSVSARVFHLPSSKTSFSFFLGQRFFRDFIQWLFFYFISIRLRTQHKWRWGDKSLYLFESVLKHKTRDEFATKNVTGKPAVDTLASFWIIFETDALLWITRAHLRFQKKINFGKWKYILENVVEITMFSFAW